MDYIEINRDSWNKRTDFHVNSAFYDVEGFLKGNSSLNQIELELLGDIQGKSLLHLQCHFGQDTISLARLGAIPTGVDLSDKAIEQAEALAKAAGANAEFICCNIYELPARLDQQFDVVFTSYGTIGWLPDLDKWAKVIAAALKPGGKFVFAEFHPVVWMFDDNFDKIDYNYFNTGPIVETETGTYADRGAPIDQKCVTWNHSIGEVLTSLLDNGLMLHAFKEFDYSPYNCFRNTVEFEPNKYRIKTLSNKIPMVYALMASKA
ncbi:class I SAM-dependent methyltransferase [Hymenobacter sp. B1770]|uniref:class I SAM-dependent methyltransferase n=1 Tax=Hymenobacter sp. B1770 TaxID=1718788 RepID=UPI003CE77E43